MVKAFQIGKNVISATNTGSNFSCYQILNFSILLFQCNVPLFSITPCKVIALNILLIAINSPSLFALTFKSKEKHPLTEIRIHKRSYSHHINEAKILRAAIIVIEER